MTIERNVAISRTNARPSTNRNTSGVLVLMTSLKSAVCAALPVTLTDDPSTLSTAAGRAPRRSIDLVDRRRQQVIAQVRQRVLRLLAARLSGQRDVQPRDRVVG